MASLAYLVRFADPPGKLVVELLGRADPELMDEQALGVGPCAADPRVLDPPLQVQVPIKAAGFGLGTGESTPAALERDASLCDGVVEGAARLDQLDEPLIEPHDGGGLAAQMVLDGPVAGVHVAQHSRTATARCQSPRAICHATTCSHPSRHFRDRLLVLMVLLEYVVVCVAKLFVEDSSGIGVLFEDCIDFSSTEYDYCLRIDRSTYNTECAFIEA